MVNNHTHNRIDTPGVIQKVSELFKNHSHLILGFNSFLPPGYKIVLENNEQSSMNAAENQQTSPTPSNASQSVVQGKKKKRSTSPPPVPAAASSKPTNDRSIDFDQAISYVTKIKKRFADSPHTYKAFLDILHNYQKEQTTIKKVYEQVSDLFKDHQDLLSEFAQFLPMPDQSKKSRKVKKVCIFILFMLLPNSSTHAINTESTATTTSSIRSNRNFR